jgi:hypothetical protein
LLIEEKVVVEIIPKGILDESKSINGIMPMDRNVRPIE